MVTSSGKRVKKGPKAAAQRKLGVYARICYVIGLLVAGVYVYFVSLYYVDLFEELHEKDQSILVYRIIALQIILLYVVFSFITSSKQSFFKFRHTNEAQLVLIILPFTLIAIGSGFVFFVRPQDGSEYFSGYFINVIVITAVFSAIIFIAPWFANLVEYVKETDIYRNTFIIGKGGSARWGGIKSYIKHDMTDFYEHYKNSAKYFDQTDNVPYKAPIYCGRTIWRNDSMMGKRDIGLDNDSHMLTIATTGAGKSLYVIWNELLSWPGGVFIFDPKGEHTQRTYPVRKDIIIPGRKFFGHKPNTEYSPFYVLDPSGAIPKEANIPIESYNPLDEIDIENNNAAADLMEIIQASFIDENVAHTGNSEYFRDKAIELAMGYTVHLLTDYPKQFHNLPSMLNLALFGSPDAIGVDEEARKVVHAKMSVNEACGKAAMIAARTLNGRAEKEIDSIISSFSNAFRWVNEPAIKKTLIGSSFSMKEIRTKGATVSVCVTLLNLKNAQYIRWFRTVSAMALLATREPINTGYEEGVKEPCKTLFLFDEFYHLGRFPQVQKGLTTLRSSNVKLHLFFQNAGQITELYKNKSTFYASCDKQFFGLGNDNETAEDISKMLGKYIDKWSEGSEDHPRYNERERALRTSSEISNQLKKGSKEQYVIPLEGLPMELELVPFYENFKKYGKVMGVDDHI
ncbi:MAG: type IV secretory system conjugative DNA transfer family protein [Flavobacteriaceae bacterium]|nr:type IV secretory system conjugative DNA transfer family protein [Flavobacteriaceae bacterium]